MVACVNLKVCVPNGTVAGIYGMNFEYMPELKWRWSYPILWIAFVAIPVVLLIHFKGKNGFRMVCHVSPEWSITN